MVAARVCLLLVLLGSASAFYLPGVAPKTFLKDAPVAIKVQTLVSPESQLQFDYYQLPFCKPQDVKDLPENLGEALMGEKAHTSGFVASMKKDIFCQTLCKMKYTKEQMQEFKDFAILGYRANMRLDNLPVAEIAKFAYDDKPEKTIQVYNLGAPVGTKLHSEEEPKKGKKGKKAPDNYVLNNHLRFTIKYHPAAEEMDDAPASSNPTENFMKGNLIVGFEVRPYSIKHTEGKDFKEGCEPDCPLSTCQAGGAFSDHGPMMIDVKDGTEVLWTYDVLWERSDVKWASRWDVYLKMTDDKVHWFSIINSMVILVFLSAIVGMIFTRILRNDLNQYNQVLTDEERAMQAEELREESGWKLVYGDVFRPPKFAGMLAVYTGIGVQLIVMVILTLACSCLGFLSPANRGSLLNAFLVFFFISGSAAGYVAARFCTIFSEENKVKITFMTAFSFQGVCCIVLLTLNMFMWAQQSSNAIPFGTFMAVIAIWFFISLPLVFVGAYAGFRGEPISLPCRVNAIPRQIPPQKWFQHGLVSALIGGLLPFGAVFVELFFILSSIWQHRFYYFFGFLTLVFVILVVTCAQISLVLCYMHLCTEDYRWWWRSFYTGGSTTIYMLAYGGYHYMVRTHRAIDFISTLVYFGYLTTICYAFFVMTGAIGFLCCFFFVRKIYGSVKID